jgi:hypothetical protein
MRILRCHQFVWRAGFATVARALNVFHVCSNCDRTCLWQASHVADLSGHWKSARGQHLTMFARATAEIPMFIVPKTNDKGRPEIHLDGAWSPICNSGTTPGAQTSFARLWGSRASAQVVSQSVLAKGAETQQRVSAS